MNLFKAVGNLDKSLVELQESVKMDPELEEAPVFDLDALISTEARAMFEGVLACSRYGMMERDIMDLLSTKPSYFRDNCPLVDAAQVRKTRNKFVVVLKDYLTVSEGVCLLTHTEVIKDRYILLLKRTFTKRSLAIF